MKLPRLSLSSPSKACPELLARRGRSVRAIRGSVYPTSINANLNPQVNGPTVSVKPAHSKIRRAGYAGNANARRIG
ncbi:exported hypothetical protein [Parafrankia sp. Ea1.12]|nr:exported hypothetical protein [Parafrankia sp. Ea1.12]